MLLIISNIKFESVYFVIKATELKTSLCFQRLCVLGEVYLMVLRNDVRITSTRQPIFLRQATPQNVNMVTYR